VIFADARLSADTIETKKGATGAFFDFIPELLAYACLYWPDFATLTPLESARFSIAEWLGNSFSN